MKIKTSYTQPKLCTRGGDITKEWYVHFRYNTLTESKQFRYKLGINSIKTKKGREKEALSIISALLMKLDNGWNPLTDEVEKVEKKDRTVSEVFDEILLLKQAYITKRSYKTYFDQTNLFKKWLVEMRYDHLYIHNFTSTHAREYLDWLLTYKKYCGKTYNGHLTVLRTFFNSAVERKYILESPVSGFKSVRQDSGKNTVYSADEEKKLSKYMLDDDFNFYLATRFVRYCFFRRSELAKLQVKHILWENRTIVVPSENSKSRVQDSVTISKTLEKLIIKSGILNLHPETYIFGQNSKNVFTPNLQQMKRVDNFSDKQRSINRLLDIKTECTFYSWKHTGAVELYNLTKDPYVVMRQCRHSDIKMTMTYLRSLGCGVSEQVREW